MSPCRIQRQRTKGWRMPDNAIYVGRPTMFGNPFKVGEIPIFECGPGVVITSNFEAVQLFSLSLEFHLRRDEDDKEPDHWCQIIIDNIDRLKGHDLVCWCSTGSACHADVLLNLANHRL